MEYIINNKAVLEQLPALSPNGVGLSSSEQPFIEANTIEMPIHEMKDQHIIPVWSASNEPLISHSEFIEAIWEKTHQIFGGETILKPNIRVSHPIKGRIPENVRAPREARPRGRRPRACQLALRPARAGPQGDRGARGELRAARGNGSLVLWPARSPRGSRGALRRGQRRRMVSRPDEGLRRADAFRRPDGNEEGLRSERCETNTRAPRPSA